ncbi:MAG: PPC domain-containing protein [Cyanobacteria bacterium P01_E01_bin.6]
MRDRAGQNLKGAQRINFKNKTTRVREFIGGDDQTDIFRFNARSSKIDITANRLGNRDTVDLYQVDGKLRRTLRRIGDTDFSSIRTRRLNKFLTSVDLSTSSRGRRDDYSADVDKGTYFLVVSSNANRSSKYRLRFSAEDASTVLPTPDTIGNTIGTAKATTLGTSESEQIGGTDNSDVFQFVLGDRQKVAFNLNGLTQNADLSLLDDSGKTLKLSVTAGTSAESITRNLEQGTYYIQVSSTSTTATNYTLTTSTSNVTQTSLYSQNVAGTAVPNDQNQLILNQVPFTATEANLIADELAVPPLFPDTAVLALLNSEDLIASSNATETPVNQGVQLNSQVNSSNTGYVGYTNYALDYSSLSLTPLNADLEPVNPSGATVLDASIGYTLSFDLAIATETSNSANRAGFSVVIVSNDGSSAIELGFDSTGIFAQSENFTATESFTPSTFSMSELVSYDLYVADSGYRLFANDTEILSGNVRTYNFDPSQSDPPLPVNPYTTQNFVFLGDNTDQASSTVTLNNVSLFT